MDFDLEDKKNSDEEIIELTEIIEKGHATSAPSNQAANAEQNIEAAMSDLGNSSSVPNIPTDDVDLDALLAQMDSDGGFSELDAALPTNSGQKGTEISAKEAALAASAPDMSDEPDMPDLADVDALLAEMDMPPQPNDAEEKKSAPVDSSDDMDDLLGSILNEPAGSNSKKVNAQPQKTHDDSLNDLDNLFEEVLGEAPLSAAELAQNVVPGGEVETNKTTAEAVADMVFAPDAQAEKTSANPIPDLTDDLDAILTASELETQEFIPPPAAAPTQKAAPETPKSVSGAVSSPPTVDEARLKSLEDRVDALEKDLASRFVVLQDSIGKSTENSTKECTEIRGMLTDFGNKLESVANAQPETSGNDDALAKIEELQGSIEQISALSEKLAGLENTVTQFAEAQSESNTGALNEEVTTQLAEMNSKLEGLESSVNEESATQLAEMKAKLHSFESSVDNMPQISEKIELLENVVSQLSETVETIEASSSTKEQGQEQGEEQASPDIQEMTEKLQNLENAVSDMHTLLEKVETLENTVAAQAETPASAESDNESAESTAQMSEVNAKLEALEKSLEEAKEREVAMKEIIAAQITKLESSINSSDKAQANEGEADTDELKSKIELLENALSAAEDRENNQLNTITSLEEKIQTLSTDMQNFEQTLQANLEKMAAAAAAKVLREEITALLSAEE